MRNSDIYVDECFVEVGDYSISDNIILATIIKITTIGSVPHLGEDSHSINEKKKVLSVPRIDFLQLKGYSD